MPPCPHPALDRRHPTGAGRLRLPDLFAGELEEDIFEGRLVHADRPYLNPDPAGGKDYLGDPGLAPVDAEVEGRAGPVDGLDPLELRECPHLLIADPVVHLQGDDVRPDQVFQVLGGVQGDDPSLVDDGDPLAEVVCLLHVVSRQDYGDPLLLVHLQDVPPDVPPGLGVQAQRRLVQKEDVRMVHQPPGDLKPPLHPARVVLHQYIRFLGQVHQLQDLGDPRLAGLSVHPVHPAVKVQVLPARELAIDGGVLEDDPDGVSDRIPLPADVEAPDGGPSGGGPEHRGQHLDDGALSRAVGAEEAEELPLLDVEVDPVDGCKAVEPHGETAGGDGWTIHE